MSNEEAIKILKEVREEVLAKETELSKQVFENLGIKAIDLAIKALEQTELNPSYNSVKTELKSSEDCVSRQKLLSRIDAERKHLLELKMDGAEHIIVHHARRIIEDMPSVTPTRPHGEWIHFTDDFKDYAACSCCGYGEEGEVLLEDKTPFCPVCGADMREAEDED